MSWKPMLAEKLKPPYDLSGRYPVLVSPKLDGVRATIQDGIVLSRSLKPIPNLHVQKLFGREELNGLDGELIIGEPTASDVFRKTTSAVMTITGKPNIFYYVFDYYHDKLPFRERLLEAGRVIRKSKINAVLLLIHHTVSTNRLLFEYETNWITQGYEGLMIRSPFGLYKRGRSTLREGWLLKLKRFVDSEAVVRGVTVLLHNNNKAKTNELGYTSRSSHKANKIPKNLMGSLIVEDVKTKGKFPIGTGFTNAERKAIWENPSKYIGRICKYKHFPTGYVDNLRFAVFLGWRDALDMDEAN